MIRLDVQPYCEKCMDFDPEVEWPSICYYDNHIRDLVGDTIIRCEHRNKCENIMKYLKGVKNNGNG